MSCPEYTPLCTAIQVECVRQCLSVYPMIIPADDPQIEDDSIEIFRKGQEGESTGWALQCGSNYVSITQVGYDDPKDESTIWVAHWESFPLVNTEAIVEALFKRMAHDVRSGEG